MKINEEILKKQFAGTYDGKMTKNDENWDSGKQQTLGPEFFQHGSTMDT